MEFWDLLVCWSIYFMMLFFMLYTVSLKKSEMRFLGFPLTSFIITMLDPFLTHAGTLDLSGSFSLKRFIPFDSPKNVSGFFSVADLKSLIPVPDL